MNIKAVPLTYKGISFRSTLEADWACTFDACGIYWQYEPLALQLPSGQQYLPDFYLPNMNCWAEVKGPHWERIDKAIELRSALKVDADWPDWFRHIHVVILEAAGPGDAASWRAPDDDKQLWFTDCGACEHVGWVERDGRCWHTGCAHVGGGNHPLYWPASSGGNEAGRPTFTMVRAPRPEIVGSKRGK